MQRKKLKVCWISAGVSSFIAGWLVRDTVDKFAYIDIADQHPDSLRFISDCEKALGKPIEILRSEKYKNVEDCIRGFGMVRNRITGFAPCTNALKKRVRKQFDEKYKEYEITNVWGMDCNEKHRADRLEETMIEFNHEFPLIDRGLSKQDAHGILAQLGIHRPKMYDMGYSNNNCIGCIKGGMGYWNKIRVDFPEVFASRAKMERDINSTIFSNKKTHEPLFLDELSPDAGRMETEIMEDCSIFCMLEAQSTDKSGFEFYRPGGEP